MKGMKDETIQSVIIMVLSIVLMVFLFSMKETFTSEKFKNKESTDEEESIGMKIYRIPTGRFPFYVEYVRNWYTTQPDPTLLGTMTGSTGFIPNNISDE